VVVGGGGGGGADVAPKLSPGKEENGWLEVEIGAELDV